MAKCSWLTWLPLRKLSLLLLMLQVLLFSRLLLERDMLLCTELLVVGADVEKYAEEQSVEQEAGPAPPAPPEEFDAAAAAAALVLGPLPKPLPVAIAATVDSAHRVALSIEEAVWE